MSNVVFAGNISFNIYPAWSAVQFNVDQLKNLSAYTSGTLRLELWLMATPWTDAATGYEVGVSRLTGTTDGTLASGQHVDNILQYASYTRPPAGTYYVALVAAEYTGKYPDVDGGYAFDAVQTFPTYLTVDSDGTLHTGVIDTPSVSIATQTIYEGGSGTKSMVFTLTLSKATPFAASVQIDTRDETAVAGVDYQALHQRVTFAPGSTTATVSVPIIGNSTPQPARAFEVNLSNASNATIKSNFVDPAGAARSYAQANAWGVIYDDDSYAGLTLPTDTYLQLEWYLYNTRTPLAWTHATGKGVKVGVFDQGIDAGNPDLAANDDVALGRLAYTLQPGGAPVGNGDNHGTNVAGVIAAARDGKGVVGVAYDAQLVPIYTSSSLLSTQYLTEIANAFHYAATLDVLNDSWGFGNLLNKDTNWAFLDNANNASYAPAFQALHDLAATGRNGLGTVVVQSAGNGYSVGDDTNLHNFQNSRYIITVGATDYFGASSSFSTTGASILVSAPGGAGHRDFASILTTDRAGAAGNSAGNFAFEDGTSFASPIVSGIVALMLEANPHLGYRDVQQILAYTAHQTDVDSGWATNGASDWNGGGLAYNAVAQSSGFGQVDALAAVRLAAAWQGTPQTVANTVDVLGTQTVNQKIPDNDRHGVTSGIAITSDMVVERVDVSVNITHPFIGDLEVMLKSPSGTTSYLMYRPSQGALSAYGSSQNDVHFTFDTVLDWGETAAGTWSLNVRDLQSGDVGVFDDWSIDLIGHAASPDHTFVYTYDFPTLAAADPRRAVLSDPNGGVDTINAAALSYDTRIDLSGATASSLNGGKLTIADGTTIRNAYGGDGNDVLIANAAGSVLHGMGGNDTLTGGAGRNRLDGGAGNDTLDGGAGIDTAIYHGAHASYTVSRTAGGYAVLDTSGADGADQLSNIERLQFADVTVGLDIDGVAGQAYRLYQAAFNRTPDAGGLGYWISQMDHGATLKQVAGNFAGSAEFQALYGAHPSNADIVTRFYDNVLHRAPDAAGAAYWTNLLDTHAISAADVLASFSESGENIAALVGATQNGIAYTPYG